METDDKCMICSLVKIQWEKQSGFREMGAVCHISVVREGPIEELTLKERLEGGKRVSL